MPQANSRTTDSVLPLGTFHGYPVLGIGEDPFSNRYHNIAAPTDPLGTLPIAPGSIYHTWDGKVFRYIKASSALALGEAVELDALTNLGTFASVAYDGDRKVTLLPTPALTAGAHVGKLLYINVGTGANQCRTIVGNTTFEVYIDRPYTTAPGATSNFDIIPVYHGNVADAAIDKILGFSTVSAITSGNFGWIQTKGVAEHVLVGAAGATTVNLLQTIIASGITNVAAGDNDTKCVVGIALATGAAGETVPAILGGYGPLL